jgi:hypothetical protein
MFLMNVTTSLNMCGRYIGFVRDPWRLKPVLNRKAKTPRPISMGIVATRSMRFPFDPNAGTTVINESIDSSMAEINVFSRMLCH